METLQPELTQAEHYQIAREKVARANQTMLILLFGPNPITDAELRALIQKRPEVYQRFAPYLGKR